jgi:hypothetical protein
LQRQPRHSTNEVQTWTTDSGDFQRSKCFSFSTHH